MARLVVKVLGADGSGPEQTLEGEMIPLDALLAGAGDAAIRFVDGRAMLEATAPIILNGAPARQSDLRSGDRLQAAPDGPTVLVVSITAPAPGPGPAPGADTALATKACPYCGEEVKTIAVKCPHCKSFLVPGQRSLLDQSEPRELKTEAHFLAIGFWWRIFSVIGGIAGGILLFMGQSTRGSPFGPGSDVQLLGGIILGICLLLFFIGLGLSWYLAWARIVNGLLCLLQLGLQLVRGLSSLGERVPEAQLAGRWMGMLLSLFLYGSIAYVMFSARGSRICSKKYRDLVQQNPQVKARMTQSIYFWIFLIVVGLILLGLFFVFMSSVKPPSRGY